VGQPIADLQLPIADWLWVKHQSKIGNRKSTIPRPTRYRGVVLTSLQASNEKLEMRMENVFADCLLVNRISVKQTS
jgi:hypothetical protein